KPRPKKDPPLPLPVVAWQVKADPGPDVAEAPKNPAGFADLDPAESLLFPTTPSRFAVARLPLVKEGWLGIDLYNMKPTGITAGRNELEDPALSPDGQLLAGKKQGFGPTLVDVWSLPQGQRVSQIQVSKDFGVLELIDFAHQGHIITGRFENL